MADTQKVEKTRRSWDAKMSHKVMHTVVTVVLTLLIIGGGAYAYIFFQRDTQATYVSNPGKARVSTVEGLNPNKGKYEETNFTMELPGDWKRLPPELSGPYKKYNYQAGLKNAENRYLSVYVDGLPLTMAVNKAVAVRAEGDRLSHGMVSQNCTEFTTKTGLASPAKWDGVDFLCDMDVTTRNVVGTSAPGSINKIELTTVGFTKHSYFFVYEDNNNTPDYTILYEMLDSFRAK